MSVTKIFTKITSADYQWLGVRLDNLQYSQVHNEAVNEQNSQITKETYKYYAYLPANLNFSTLEYETFIKDVNWSNGRPIEDQLTAQPLSRDWNSVVSVTVNQLQVELAEQQWANVFNINNADATISFAYADLHRDASGVTYVGGDNTGIGGGDYRNQYVIFINHELYKEPSDPALGGVDTRNLSLGTWGGWTAMHELGHVWGQSHTPAPGKSDDLRFTIMAYPDSFITTKIPLTPGMDDIKAMQIKYGLSEAQDGNTNYVFGQGSADLGHGNVLAGAIGTNLNQYVMTLSDRASAAGGTDTIDASSLSTKVYINLNDGEFSAIGTDTNQAPTTGDNYNGTGNLDGDTTYNVGIAVGAEIENAKGGGKNDTLIGNELNNTLDGGIGADVLQGGAGNDTYIVDNIGDVVTESAATDGTDWVRSSIGYTLGAHLENLVLTGASTINGTGNELNNILMGNSANNRLEGKGGNDIYTVNSTGDVIVEQQGGGTDTVYTTANITMAANVENLVVDLTATLTVTGNELNNLMIGNAVANTIKGGKGHDTINGGGGNDTLWGDTSLISGTNATNSSNGGNDTLRGGDGADNVYGESGDDTLYGDSGNDNLDGGFGHDILYGGLDSDGLTGGKGNDTLLGGLGNDAYKFAQIAPTSLESLGKDTIQDEDYSGTVLMGAALLSSATVKAGAENTWIANTGETIIASGDVNSGRVDLQILGNWTTHLNLADRVRTLDVTIKDFSNGDLGVTLGGVSNHHFRGDDNANTMAGSAGADTLVGKKGDDTYTLNHSGDRVVEFSNEGVDTVNSYIDAIELSANVENLTLIGDAVLGKGNTQANVIIGNAQDNQLLGAEGNDTLEGGLGLDMLDGGLGADTLTGGLGSDIFKYSSYLDSQPLSLFDVITDFSSSDFDRIDLSLLDAISTTSTKETFIYVGTDAFTGAGQLRFDVASQALFADFNGDTYADFQIVLTGVNQLLATDLIV